jgi:lipooligosaccharide transport system permease protein
MIESLFLAGHVVRRNWAVYRKDLLANISPTLADPGFLLLALGFGLAPFVGEIQGLTYIQFLAPGLVATTALFTAFFECSYGFYVRMTYESVFKAMLTTPIGPREVVVGEFLWVFVKGAIMAGGVGFVLLLAGVVVNPWGVIWLPLIGGLLAVPCGAIGLISAGLVNNINQVQTVYSFLIAPLYFLGGVFFPISSTPLWFQWGVQISPFYHGVSLMQMAAWGRFDFGGLLWHGGILIVFSVVFGLWAQRVIYRKLVS